MNLYWNQWVLITYLEVINHLMNRHNLCTAKKCSYNLRIFGSSHEIRLIILGSESENASKQDLGRNLYLITQNK